MLAANFDYRHYCDLSLESINSTLDSLADDPALVEKFEDVNFEACMRARVSVHIKRCAGIQRPVSLHLWFGAASMFADVAGGRPLP